MANLETHYLSFSLLVVIHLLTKSAINGAEEAVLISCDQTPHPQLCSSELGTQKSKSTSHFRKLVLRKTLHCAVKTHRQTSATDISGLSRQAKAAWQDCAALCADTINLLGTCTATSPSTSSSYDDAQTWLSAAMANQQTCIDGFLDFGGELPRQYSAVYAAGNLTEWISNALAVNKAMAPPDTGSRRRLLSDGFPAWLSVGDRRLLQQQNSSGSSSAAAALKADIVVAQDGSGDYTSIKAGVAAAGGRQSGSGRVVIYVKAGVYKEYVVIGKSMKNLMMVGDGIGATVVTGSKNVQDGSTTFQSATFAISGDGFIAQDMTFRNTAGPQKHQAVAVRSGSDLSVFYRCSFEGYQDTLYVYSQRQFYRQCNVYGTVDFIFGDAAVVFQNCNLYVSRPLNGQENTLTAQGRSDPNENTGISVQDSVIAAVSDLGSTKTYLGRPWKKYSRTVFMESSLGSIINPAGWLEWSGNFALSTLYYGEYKNTGAGASTAGRVNWAGYHVITSAAEASKFTVGNFISGDSWLPATGAPYTSGL